MENELIVKEKTQISPLSAKRDILSLYNVPDMLDTITKKEKSNFLNMLNCGAIGADSINRIANAEGFIVEIPKGLRDALRTGQATLDKSSKNIGSFTPNIRLRGENGIKGQITISEGTDYQAITQSISNLAMMAMVQSVLEKLDVIEDKVNDIKDGQKNDRVGTIIGSFKSFMELYPTFKSKKELDNAAMSHYKDIQQGLGQFHLQLEQERKKLIDAPKNGLQIFWKSICHPFRSDLNLYRKYYSDFVYDLQLYNRLILLSDVILYLKGDSDVIERNHKIMLEYCNHFLDNEFRKTINFIMNGNTKELSCIDNYNKNLSKSLQNILQKGICIECKAEDVKLLSYNKNESKNI